MARYTGPVCRLCRREKMKLFLKGPKCDTMKCPIERRPYPPGEQGRGRTNVDWRGRETSPPPNSKVGVDVDGDAFARLLIDRVTSLG